MNRNLKNVLAQITALLYPYSIILAGALIILMLYSKETIYFSINRLHSHFGDVFFSSITDIGSFAGAIFISVLLAMFTYRGALLLVSSYILTALINFGLKAIFAMPRPKQYFAHYTGEIYFVPGVNVQANFQSFPSGHAVCIFTAATVLTYLSKDKRWAWLYLFVALLIAYSRMYLSWHFLQDVTAGSVVGIVLSVCWLYWLDARKFIHTLKWTRGLLR